MVELTRSVRALRGQPEPEVKDEDSKAKQVWANPGDGPLSCTHTHNTHNTHKQTHLARTRTLFSSYSITGVRDFELGERALRIVRFGHMRTGEDRRRN
jgi:hypothetical protein